MKRYHVHRQKYLVDLFGIRTYSQTPTTSNQVFYPCFYAQNYFGVHSAAVTYEFFNQTTHQYEAASALLPNMFALGYPVTQPMLAPLDPTASDRVYPLLPPGAPPYTVPVVEANLPFYGCFFQARTSLSQFQFPQFRLYRKFRLLGATLSITRRINLQGPALGAPYTVYINRSPDATYTNLADMIGNPKTFTRMLRPGRTLKLSFPALISPREITWAEAIRAVVSPDALDQPEIVNHLETPIHNIMSHRETVGRFRRYPWRDCARYVEFSSKRFYTPTQGQAQTQANATGFILGEVAGKLLSVCGPTLCITSPYRPLQPTATDPVVSLPLFVPPPANEFAPMVDGTDLQCSYTIRVAFSQMLSAPLSAFSADQFNLDMVHPFVPHTIRSITDIRNALSLVQAQVVPP